VAHQSTGTGDQQHYFSHATATMTVNTGEVLMAYVYLDPANPPQQVMLQWNDGSWDHRAYWGESVTYYGVEGTASRRAMGALPAAGQWVRLEVPAAQVGLEGRTIKGMAFSLYGGSVTWDRVGKFTLPLGGDAPVRLALKRADAGLTITWNSTPERAYRIQSTTSLAADGWVDVDTVTATGATTSWIDTSESAAYRFYRIATE
jgi:hypothetical protein